MREIKFRAWYKEEKYMGQVVQIYWPTRLKQQGEVHILVGELDTEKIYVGVGGHYYLPYSSIELMQYTGLLDKNGKEIYEGDILDSIWVVEWLPKQACYVLNDQGAKEEFSEYTTKKSEVIGNIYENPV